MDAVTVERAAEIPPRTLLAPVQPRGLGTMWVESLSSYFQRLADQHSISPKLVAREFVLPKLGFNNRVGEVQSDRYWRSSFFNGMGEVPQLWCRALEELTGVAGLHRLTLLPLHGLISMKGCSSETRRWCPLCLHESELEGRPYGQLLWEIGCVMVCPTHEIQLVDAHGCSAEEAIPPLRVKPLPHLCRSCGRSVSLPSTANHQAGDPVDVSFARTVGNLLASPLFAEGQRDSDRTSLDFLAEVIQSFESGMAAKAVRRIGASKGEVSDWLHRRHLPSLPQAALIARAYGVPLQDVLVGKGGNKPHPNSWWMAARPTRFRPYVRHTRVENVEAHLRDFLTLPTSPSVAEAAGMVGVPSRELHQHYPELCHAIAERRASWIEQEAKRRRDERLEAVQELVNQMVSEGVIPTIARLEDRVLGIPKAFLFKERSACKRICAAGKAELAG